MRALLPLRSWGGDVAARHWIREGKGPGIRTDLERHLLPVRAVIYERIEGEFARWALTPSERHIAYLMLKGLRLRAIARARNTCERTVSQHARAIYHKAGVPGRAGFAAHFLTVVLAVLAIESPVFVRTRCGRLV